MLLDKMDKIKLSLNHKDILGKGAKLRNKYNLNKKQEFEVIMKEYNRGTLFSGNGKKVKNVEQARAIAMNEWRKRNVK